MKWTIRAVGLLVVGCAQQSVTPAVPAYVVAACAMPAFDGEHQDCETIATKPLAAVFAARPGTEVQSVFAAMRPYSPYGPTNQGWRGLSPGRKPGGKGPASLADGVMHSVQTLDVTSQLNSKAASADDVARAIGAGLKPVAGL